MANASNDIVFSDLPNGDRIVLRVGQRGISIGIEVRSIPGRDPFVTPKLWTPGTDAAAMTEAKEIAEEVEADWLHYTGRSR